MFARHREAIEAAKSKDTKRPWVHWKWKGKDYYGEVTGVPEPGWLDVEEHNDFKTLWVIHESMAVGIG